MDELERELYEYESDLLDLLQQIEESDDHE
jgi:hypothetical protein